MPENRSALSDQLFRVTRRLRQASAAATEPLGVSPHQVRAMHVLLRLDGARLSDLADRLRIAPRSATEVVDGLEAKGWVTRSPDPSDRRAVRAELTQAGRELLTDADRARGAVHARLLEVLTPEEQAQLGALLGKLEAGEREAGDDAGTQSDRQDRFTPGSNC